MKLFYLTEMLGRLVKKSRAADVSRNSEANMEFLTNERVTLSKYPPLICILFFPSTSGNSSLPLWQTGWGWGDHTCPFACQYSLCLLCWQNCPNSSPLSKLGWLRWFCDPQPWDRMMNTTGSLLICSLQPVPPHLIIFIWLVLPDHRGRILLVPAPPTMESFVLICRQYCAGTFHPKHFSRDGTEVPSTGVSGKTG